MRLFLALVCGPDGPRDLTLMSCDHVSFAIPTTFTLAFLTFFLDVGIDKDSMC